MIAQATQGGGELMQVKGAGITFEVDPVEPATERLTECRAYDALVHLAGREAIACSDYTGDVVADVKYHPLVFAVHLAYRDHRPLVLSPDMIWLTIAQGLKYHIRKHSEALRAHLVSHSGTKRIAVELPREFVLDSPYADWESVIEEFARAVVEAVRPELRELMLDHFSTTGPAERTAFIVTMLDAFSRYFTYSASIICGIPEITLEGTPADWERIRSKAAVLDDVGLSRWREDLDPILEQFVRAAGGDVETEHWRSIYKTWYVYGGDRITGWILYLFPYLLDRTTGRIYENDAIAKQKLIPEPPEEVIRDPLGSFVDEFAGDADPEEAGISARERYRRIVARINPGVTMDRFPFGLSQAPITVTEAQTGARRVFDLSAGFTGIRQEGLAVRPVIGWAVHEQTPLDAALEELESTGAVRRVSPWRFGGEVRLSEELQRLYARVGRAVLCRRGLRRPVRIRRRSILNAYGVDPGRGRTIRARALGWRIAVGRLLARRWERADEFTDRVASAADLYRLVDLADGSSISPFATGADGRWHYVRFRRRGGQDRLPVVAASLAELLEQLLAAADPTFADHGYYEVCESDGEMVQYRWVRDQGRLPQPRGQSGTVR